MVPKPNLEAYRVERMTNSPDAYDFNMAGYILREAAPLDRGGSVARRT